MKVGIILTPNTRSKAYLQKIIQNKILLDSIIFMNDQRKTKEFSTEIIEHGKKCGFDITNSIEETLRKYQLQYKEFQFVDINHHELIKFVQNSKIDIFIFTGGGILKTKILSVGSKFIHLHPGIVPEYRGSTCFYYSIINDDQCGVTAFFMDEKLDTGDIILQKYFKKPDHEFIDEIYDSHIRSETLVELLKNKKYEDKSILKQQNLDQGETYYVIHPVLKHIAILNCLK